MLDGAPSGDGKERLRATEWLRSFRSRDDAWDACVAGDLMLVMCWGNDHDYGHDGHDGHDGGGDGDDGGDDDGGGGIDDDDDEAFVLFLLLLRA